MVALRRSLAVVALLVGLVSLAGPVAGAGASGGVARIRLTGVIDQVNASYIEEALKAAASGNYRAALIVIDSPGVSSPARTGWSRPSWPASSR